MRDNPFSSMSPPRGSLAVIVRTYKAAVTTECRRTGHAGFAWQRGYYERIIRDDAELDRIRQYILDNPAQWEIDEENPDGGQTSDEVAPRTKEVPKCPVEYT